MPEEEPAEKPKEPKGIRITFKKLKAWWGQIAFMAAVLAAIGAGVIWVGTTLHEYKQRAVDIGTLKDLTNSIQAQQAVINERITGNVNKATKQITTEFQTRDEVDRELDARIDAVRNEMRARHGIIPLAEGGGVRVRARHVREAQEATDSAHVDMPEDDPLVGLGSF